MGSKAPVVCSNTSGQADQNSGATGKHKYWPFRRFAKISKYVIQQTMCSGKDWCFHVSFHVRILSGYIDCHFSYVILSWPTWKKVHKVFFHPVGDVQALLKGWPSRAVFIKFVLHWFFFSFENETLPTEWNCSLTQHSVVYFLVLFFFIFFPST